jgi:putative addiction module component (TIGR02574 family)
MTQLIQDILKLSVSERILMVETIWNSIIEEDHQLELSSETKQLLDERILDHDSNPEEGSSWDDVKARIINQL